MNKGGGGGKPHEWRRMDGLVAGTLQRRSKGRSVRLSSRSRAPPRPEDLQCSAPARHSEDLPPKHSETQLPERLQNGCRITAPAYAHRDSIGLATALATATHRIPDLAIPRDARSPRPRTRAARAEFPALASPPRGPESRERSVGVTVTPCAVGRGGPCYSALLRGWTAPSLVRG